MTLDLGSRTTARNRSTHTGATYAVPTKSWRRTFCDVNAAVGDPSAVAMPHERGGDRYDSVCDASVGWWAAIPRRLACIQRHDPRIPRWPRVQLVARWHRLDIDDREAAAG